MVTYIVWEKGDDTIDSAGRRRGQNRSGGKRPHRIAGLTLYNIARLSG